MTACLPNSPPGDGKRSVLFVCTHNSARSQLAEALMNHFHGDEFRACSAGVEPSGVNMYARIVMEELGVDMARHRSKSIREFTDRGMEFDYVVTVCDHARETCPLFPGGKTRLHQSFSDPSRVRGTDTERRDAFRRTREEIRAWIESTFFSSTPPDRVAGFDFSGNADLSGDPEASEDADLSGGAEASGDADLSGGP